MKKIFCIVLFFLSYHIDGLALELNQLKYEQLEKLLTKGDQAFKCIDLSLESPYYIGIIHKISLQKPMDLVENVLLDFANYSNIFSGINKASTVAKNSNNSEITAEFSNNSPVFFLPKTKYQLHYKINKTSERIEFDFKLNENFKQNDLKKMEGKIYLSNKSSSKNETQYIEVDLFEPNVGLAGKFIAAKIWPTSLKETILSDFELKLKTENPTWNRHEIEVKSQELMSKIKDDLDLCLKNKIPASEIK